MDRVPNGVFDRSSQLGVEGMLAGAGLDAENAFARRTGFSLAAALARVAREIAFEPEQEARAAEPPPARPLARAMPGWLAARTQIAAKQAARATVRKPASNATPRPKRMAPKPKRSAARVVWRAQEKAAKVRQVAVVTTVAPPAVRLRLAA